MNLLKPWKSHFHALLLHPTEAKVLLRNKHDQYCLPSVEINQRISLYDVVTIKEAIEEELDIAINVLHYASYEIEKKQHKIQGIYVLEPHDFIPEITGDIWCDRSALEKVSLIEPDHKPIIK